MIIRTRIGLGLGALWVGMLLVVGCSKKPQDAQISEMTISFPIESYLHQTVSTYGGAITADLTLLIDGREHARNVLNFDSLYVYE